ncbi:MAG: putative multidrug export ATP-binding/permease protein [Candidatus Heimdallarchaeota archaeon LC_3]|nr:MAG: putative multidrug export ATP-binding/permease protein [Candidatus Heimdallarchaeota archaeon LC_3]
MHSITNPKDDFLISSQSEIRKNTHYRSSITMFFSIYRKSPITLILAIIFLLITTLSQTLPALITGQALGELEKNGFTDEFLYLSGLIVLLSLTFVVAGFIGNYTFFKAASAYERDIRQESFDIIQDHSLTFHDNENSSQLLSKLTNEITQMRAGIFPSQRMLIATGFAIVLTLFFLYQISPIYSFVTFFGIIIYAYFAFIVAKKITPVRRDLATEIGNLTESSQEIFRGIEVVRGLSAEQREKNKFSEQSSKYSTLMRIEGRFQAFYMPTLIISILTAVIFAMALIDVWNGRILVENLIIAVALLFTLQMATRTMPMAFLMTQAGLINAQRIWNIINWQDPQPDEAIDEYGLEESIDWKGELSFKNVDFSYGNGNGDSKLVIKNFNINIPGGSKVAVIGGPGGGKSTVLKLLLRLYDPQGGMITIDGKNYTEIPASIIRKHVSRVEQELFLFTGTIKENIIFSNPNASEENIISVAKAAQAHGFIDQMTEKYDSLIGERGITLSGGQKQRIGIARALLANPDILLLDDSVSAVDSKTEYYLRKALDNLMENRTSFTVTQRLVTLVNADYIMLLDKGKIIAFGTHKELIKSSSEYKRIFELLPRSEQIEASFNGGMN